VWGDIRVDTASWTTGCCPDSAATHSRQAPSGGNVSEIYYPIVCGEPWASDRPTALADQRNSFAYQTGLQSARWRQHVCQFIPKSAAAVGRQQLTVSRVPVLAFNGAADPIDPPPNMASAQKFWPNSRELALPSQGTRPEHRDLGPCAGPIMQAFIQQASVAHLDTSCLATSPIPPFCPYPPGGGRRVNSR
jgi:hypothetical protein